MKKENQLLSRLIKAVTGKEDEAVVEAVVDVAEAVEFVELVADESEVSLELADVKSQLGVALATVSELSQKFEVAQAALAAIAAEKAELVAQAVAAKMTARKDKVELVIGTAKAEALLLATEGLDDAAFDAVVSALTGSIEAEAKSSLFKEVGVAAEADSQVVEESKEMKLLKKKYQSA